VTNDKSGAFKPQVDVFDTPESFIFYDSLPGAKKEDIGVNRDSKNGELGIAGVIHRPGGEESQKTLDLDGRRFGTFHRKVRLGSRDSLAQVDVDAIAARLEDGILTINVPKLKTDYAEVKMIDNVQ
jgi:HSP20 family protein